MNQVWLFFSILNLLADSVCMTAHVVGSLYSAEPLPHNMVFCGTFAGFIMIALIRTTRILMGLRTRFYPTIVIDLFGIIMHFLCALLSMHYAENDFHLIFMGPQQELDHHYFSHCKQQSIASIFAGALYLLQFALVLDFIDKTPPQEDENPIKIITELPEWDDDYKNMSIEEHDQLARTRANVYLFGRQVDHWLRVKSKWFRQLAGGQELKNKSELFAFRKRKSSITDSDAEDKDEHKVDRSIASKISSIEISKKTKFDVAVNTVTLSATSTESSTQSSDRR